MCDIWTDIMSDCQLDVSQISEDKDLSSQNNISNAIRANSIHLKGLEESSEHANFDEYNENSLVE